MSVFVADGVDAEAEMLALPEDICRKFLKYAQRILDGKVNPARLQPVCPAWNGVEAFLAQIGDCQMIFAVERFAPNGEIVVTILFAGRHAFSSSPAATTAIRRLNTCFP